MNESRHFVLKKLHSLSGVIPVAAFVMFHLFENGHSVAGAKAFNEFTAMMRSLPYLYAIEVTLLAPIIFHALLGIYFAMNAKHNVSQFGTRANWAYFFQRVTGIILVVFIGAHLYNTRFANIPADQMFQHLAEGYSHAWIFWGYIIGVAAASFHLSNGLWGFAIAWGIVTGQKSQDMLWKACMGLGLTVFLMGANAAYGFKGQGIDWFQHEKTPAVAAAAADAATLPNTTPVNH